MCLLNGSSTLAEARVVSSFICPHGSIYTEQHHLCMIEKFFPITKTYELQLSSRKRPVLWNRMKPYDYENFLIRKVLHDMGV